MAISRQYCDECRRWVRAERTEPNHVLHLLLTVLTCGVWATIWVVLAALPPPWTCSRCGSRC